MLDSVNAFVVCLQQALVGEDSAEEQLFSSEGTRAKDGLSSELDIYMQKLKVYTAFKSDFSVILFISFLNENIDEMNNFIQGNDIVLSSLGLDLVTVVTWFLRVVLPPRGFSFIDGKII